MNLEQNILPKKLTNGVKNYRKQHMPVSALVNRISIVISFVQEPSMRELIKPVNKIIQNDLVPSIIG